MPAVLSAGTHRPAQQAERFVKHLSEERFTTGLIVEGKPGLHPVRLWTGNESKRSCSNTPQPPPQRENWTEILDFRLYDPEFWKFWS